MKFNSLYFIVGGIVVLGILFFLFKPRGVLDSNPSPVPAPTTNSEATSASSPNLDNVFELVVKNKKLVSGPETIQVMEGEMVTIKITSDEDEELHVHGYDKSIKLAANEPAELKFTANLTGRFPYELENSKTDIGTLEVQPK